MSRLIPNSYKRGDNLESFIKDCQRFFNGTKTPKANREILVKALLDRELLEEYEQVSMEITGFEEKLRKAFEKPKTLMDDLRQALEYRRGTESTEKFFETVENLSKKLLAHKWEEAELVGYLLLHCSNDSEVHKEVTLREIKE